MDTLYTFGILLPTIKGISVDFLGLMNSAAKTTLDRKPAHRIKQALPLC